MAVGLIDRRISRQTGKIAVAVHVVDERPFAAHQCDIERFVVVGAKAGFRRDDFFCLVHVMRLHQAGCVGRSKMRRPKALAVSSTISRALLPRSSTKGLSSTRS